MESTNGLNIRDDYPQRLGDSTKDLIWRQAWLLNMCFLPSPLEHQKKFNGIRINGWDCPLLRSIGDVLEPPKGRRRQGDETEILLNMNCSKAFVLLLPSP